MKKNEKNVNENLNKDKKKKKKNNKNVRVKCQTNFLKDISDDIVILKKNKKLISDKIKKQNFEKRKIESSINKKKKLNPSKVRRRSLRAAKFINPLSDCLKGCTSIRTDSMDYIFYYGSGSSKRIENFNFKLLWFLLSDDEKSLIIRLVSSREDWIKKFCAHSEEDFLRVLNTATDGCILCSYLSFFDLKFTGNKIFGLKLIPFGMDDVKSFFQVKNFKNF